MEAKAVVQSGLLHPQKGPWLVFFSHGIVCSISEGLCHVRNIPEFSGKECHVSAHGWLCMEDMWTHDLSLVNPVSMEKIDLPTLPSSSRLKYETSDCILSGPPTDPTCTVLFVDCFNPAIVYWNQHHRKWNEMQYKLNEDGGIFQCVVLNGKMYGLTYKGVLIVVEFNPDPVVRVLETIGPDRVPSQMFAMQKFLVESCGEIFLVYLIYSGCDDNDIYTIEVLKLDILEMKCVRVEDLGDRAFFLQHPLSVSCCASEESGVKAGCIYYLRDEGVPVLYRFEMADNTLTMNVPWPDLSTPWSEAHWVMLSSV